MQTNILTDLESSAETLVAELSAILNIAEPESAIAILAKNSLSLALAMNNDLACEVERVTS